MKAEPMLLTEIYDKSILEDESKIFQIKENGVRAIVHVKDKKIVGIRNRSGLPILFSFPEFKDIELPFGQAILDCEICVFKDGKSVFYGGIDKRRSLPSESVLKEFPATMVVFDAILVEKEVLVMKPYGYRYSKIKDIPETNNNVKVAKNYTGKVWEEVKAKNLEGVVVKNPNALYELGKRSKEYLKLKNYKVTQVQVTETEPNSKGTKIFGDLEIEGNKVRVEAQLAGIFDVEIGSTQYIKYLDIVGDRLILPTKVSREQLKAY